MVDAHPFAFPPTGTASALFHMQSDFIVPGGCDATLDKGASRLVSVIPTLVKLLALAPAQGWPVLHTRRAKGPDSCDWPFAKAARGPAALKTGDMGVIGLRWRYKSLRQRGTKT